MHDLARWTIDRRISHSPTRKCTKLTTFLFTLKWNFNNLSWADDVFFNLAHLERFMRGRYTSVLECLSPCGPFFHLANKCEIGSLFFQSSKDLLSISMRFKTILLILSLMSLDSSKRQSNQIHTIVKSLFVSFGFEMSSLPVWKLWRQTDRPLQGQRWQWRV